jgi:hypothetical protein
VKNPDTSLFLGGYRFPRFYHKYVTINDTPDQISSNLIDAPQKGSEKATLTTGDRRVLGAVLHDEKIWVTFNALIDNRTKACWAKFDPYGSSTVLDHGVIGKTFPRMRVPLPLLLLSPATGPLGLVFLHLRRISMLAHM